MELTTTKGKLTTANLAPVYLPLCISFLPPSNSFTMGNYDNLKLLSVDKISIATTTAENQLTKIALKMWENFVMTFESDQRFCMGNRIYDTTTGGVLGITRSSHLY